MHTYLVGLGALALSRCKRVQFSVDPGSSEEVFVLNGTPGTCSQPEAIAEDAKEETGCEISPRGDTREICSSPTGRKRVGIELLFGLSCTESAFDGNMFEESRRAEC